MPTKPHVDAGNPQTQAGRRFPDTYYDIHRSARFPLGRPWNGYREYAANPELGHQPGFVNSDLMQGHHEDPFNTQWSAPWIPEARYFHCDDRRKIITFKYEKARADEQQALDRYYEAAAMISADKGWGEVEYGAPLSYQVRAVIGRAPKMLKIIEAAIAGDPWLLGHIDEPNDELAALLNFKVIRAGGLERPRAIGTPVIGRPAEPAPPVTPEQALASSPAELATMIAQIVNATLDAREAAKNQNRTSAARAKRAENRTKTNTSEAESMAS